MHVQVKLNVPMQIKTYIHKAIMEMHAKKRGAKATIFSNFRRQCAAHNPLEPGAARGIVVCRELRIRGTNNQETDHRHYCHRELATFPSTHF